MKKTQEPKLKLNRETLQNLERPQLQAVAGAASAGCHWWTTASCVGGC